MTNNRNGDRPYQTTGSADWKLIGTTVAIFAVMVTALWTIVTNENANNKAIIDDLRNNYTTNREHNDLVNRLNREVARANADIDRLELQSRRNHDDALSRVEFKLWQDERTKTVDRLIEQVDKMTTRVEQVVRDRASVESTNSLQRQIDELSKRLEAVSLREDQRHIKTDK